MSRVVVCGSLNMDVVVQSKRRPAAGETLLKLIETLDDHDDVQNVYGNYELSDALLAKRK